VSTVMAYRDWPDAPVDEDSPLWDGDPDFDPGPRGWRPDEYGWLRAGGELACRAELSDERLLTIRLHDMLGQYEDADPVLWWLERMTRGDPVLLPAPDSGIQALDVRDASRFLADQVERGAHGTFNVGAPAEGRAFGGMVRACADAVGAQPELVWADQGWLGDQGVRPWTDIMPWRNAAAPWAVSVDRARAAGLRCRPMAETAADTWRWLTTGGRERASERLAGYGLGAAREAALVARWRETVTTSPADGPTG
jgi:2'-hydroxyisoflavone reductase